MGSLVMLVVPVSVVGVSCESLPESDALDLCSVG